MKELQVGGRESQVSQSFSVIGEQIQLPTHEAENSGGRPDLGREPLPLHRRSLMEKIQGLVSGVLTTE